MFEIKATPEFTLQQLLAEADHWKVELLKYSQIYEGEMGAVVVLRGPNTIAYLQALERKQELLDEDRDLPYDY